MNKTELEEKIKNGESVWVVDKDLKRVIPYNANRIIVNNFNADALGYNFEDLYKTQAEAEHYLHHANITRTETLPFLTWEEFDKGDRLIRFTGKNGEKCKLEGYQHDDKQSGFIDIVVNGTGSHIDYDYTEQDFYKAYDEAVRFFNGE